MARLGARQWEALGKIFAEWLTLLADAVTEVTPELCTSSDPNVLGVGATCRVELSGDDAMGSRKDGRRATISSKYCVIAMGGDQLGDFSDLFNAGQAVPARRAATLTLPIAGMWGNGWFVMLNPVYGSGLKGGFDDVFPMDKRWAPPAKGEQ